MGGKIMTTIIGITGYQGTDPRTSAVVLASDVASTLQNWEAKGDVAYMQRTRKEAQKIYINDSGDAAIAMSGVGIASIPNSSMTF